MDWGIRNQNGSIVVLVTRVLGSWAVKTEKSQKRRSLLWLPFSSSSQFSYLRVKKREQLNSKIAASALVVPSPIPNSIRSYFDSQPSHRIANSQGKYKNCFQFYYYNYNNDYYFCICGIVAVWFIRSTWTSFLAFGRDWFRWCNPAGIYSVRTQPRPYW